MLFVLKGLIANLIEATLLIHKDHGEGTSSSSTQSPACQILQTIMEGTPLSQSTNRLAEILETSSITEKQNDGDVSMSISFCIHDLEITINIYMISCYHVYMSIYISELIAFSKILQKLPNQHDERTLLVTFSSGHPLTEDELHDFFMRYHYH